MNERIKELEDQCWKELSEEEGMYQVFDTKKFAELIVKECANVATQCDVNGYGDFREGISQRIKEHFGVE